MTVHADAPTCGRTYAGAYAEHVQTAPCDRLADHAGFCEFPALRPSPESFSVVLADLRWPASQNWLAQRAGVDAATVNRLEKGTRQPSRRMVTALAEALVLDAHDRGRLFAAAGYVDRGVTS